MGSKRKRIIIIVSIILVIAIILGIVFAIINDKSSDDIKVYDNVFVINKESLNNNPIEVTDNELIFSIDQHYAQGDIIVAGVLDTAPNGFIRKVVKAEIVDNRYVVQTTYACLTDVFEEAHFSKAFSISDEAVTPVDTAETSTNARIGIIQPPKSFANTLEIGTLIPNKDSEADLISLEIKKNITENVSVTASVGFRPYLLIDFDIENHEIEFSMAIKNTTQGRLAVELGSEKKFEESVDVFSKKLPVLEFTIGTVPIVITNSIGASLDGSGEISGSLGTEITLDYENTTGFKYSSSTNTVEEIKENTYLGDGIEWNTKASASAEIETGVFFHIVSKLYDTAGVDLAAGVTGSAEAEIMLNPNQKFTNLNYEGTIKLAITPKLKGDIVVTYPVIGHKLLSQSLFELELKPLWEKEWDSSTTIVGKNSKISLLVFEPGWPALSIPDEYSNLKWWDKSAKSERASFYEKDAIELLKGNAKTDWILENDTFSDKKYQDGEGVEGLTVSYYEATYDGKSNLNCKLICSPFTRWKGAFVKVYIDEEYFTTIQYPSEPVLMNEYVWDICCIEDKQFSVGNSTTLLEEWLTSESSTKNNTVGQVNSVLMVHDYADCDKLTLSTEDDKLYLKYKDDSEKYSISGNTILSPVLDLYKNDIRIATISVVNYACSTVEELNLSYAKPDTIYETEYISIDDYTYSYLKSEDGEILPMVRGQLYIGGICLYPVIHFNSEIESEKELKNTLNGLKWSYEWSLNY